MSHKHRYVWADVVRSLAIFFVVYIHTRSRASDIFDLASSICISLFFLLSGALLLSKQEKIILFLRKRVIKIVIPWIFWTSVWFVFEYQGLHISAERYFLTRFWFLPIIFSMYLFTPFLRRYIVKLNTNTLLLFLILWFVFLILLPIILLHRGIYNPSNTILTIFQFLGIYFLGYVITNRYKPSGKIFLWVGLFFISIIAILIEQKLWQTMTQYRLNAFPYNFITPELIAASVGVFIAIYILFNGKYEKYLSQPIQNVITNISHSAFGVYLIHEFFILLYDRFSIPTFLPLERTIIVFLLSCLFIIFLKKIPFIKLLVP